MILILANHNGVSVGFSAALFPTTTDPIHYHIVVTAIQDPQIVSEMNKLHTVCLSEFTCALDDEI